MIRKPKYKVGDTVWFVGNDKRSLYSASVLAVSASKEEVRYTTSDEPDVDIIEERVLPSFEIAENALSRVATNEANKLMAGITEIAAFGRATQDLKRVLIHNSRLMVEEYSDGSYCIITSAMTVGNFGSLWEAPVSDSATIIIGKE